ncbi:MAG: YkvA family protein [Chloroflexota bacterium]|nr:YkvA family protein [Chloroflexota bacterium]
MLEPIRKRARHLKNEVFALYLAYRDPRVPWYAKVFIAFVVAYAFSPIDLIPDFIPVLGYLDDLILIPLGVTLALRMIPPDVLAECREQAQALAAQGKPINRTAASVIVGIWILGGILVFTWLFGMVAATR